MKTLLNQNYLQYKKNVFSVSNLKVDSTCSYSTWPNIASVRKETVTTYQMTAGTTLNDQPRPLAVVKLPNERGLWKSTPARKVITVTDSDPGKLADVKSVFTTEREQLNK